MTKDSILASYSSFPVKLSKEEGLILKRAFTLQKENEPQEAFSKSIRHKYVLNSAGRRYILIVEYLFRDNEFILDLKRSIGANYYLNIGE